MWHGINGDIAFTLDGHYYLGCGSRGGREREVVYWVDDMQDTTGTLSPGAHPGSYNGQDAYSGLLVVEDGTGNRKRTDESVSDERPGRSIELHARPTSNNDRGGGDTQMNVVRRLTPLECERLQGFPDGWTDIGEWTDSKGKKHKAADAPRYKALGNSIAIPFWEWMARRIVAQYDRPVTMASLFDGIGGFPLSFERAGATAIWASEIEEFPMAVTKLRFPEGANDA